MTTTPPPVTPPPATPVYAPAGVAPKTNTLSIIALIAAFVIPLAGIIVGHIALGQIKRTGEGGHGLALWGTILGYVFTALYIIFIIVYVVIIAAVVGSSHSYSTY